MKELLAREICNGDSTIALTFKFKFWGKNQNKQFWKDRIEELDFEFAFFINTVPTFLDQIA